MSNNNQSIHHFKPGDYFGDQDRFKLEQLIGVGGFADVYKAIDNFTDLIIALKIYTNLDNEDIKSLSKEYARMSSLYHQNILRANYFGSWQNKPYLIMEFCEGGSLDRKLGKLTEPQLMKLVEDVANGLDYLHQNDIIHQDIKPANILETTKNGIPSYKLSDFGISNKSKKNLSKSINVADKGLSMTVAYAPPEKFSHIRAEREPDARGDIFSFGLTIYEIITEDLPLGEISTGNQMYNYPENTLIDLSEIPYPRLRWIVDRCVQADKDMRLTAKEIVRLLHADESLIPPKYLNDLTPTPYINIEIERQRRLEEERRRQQEEAERQRLEEERRRQQEEAERQRLEEERRRQQEETERQRLEEERRRQEEEAERQRLEEERRRQEEEAERQRLEEERRREEEARIAEEERLKAEREKNKTVRAITVKLPSRKKKGSTNGSSGKNTVISSVSLRFNFDKDEDVPPPLQTACGGGNGGNKNNDSKTKKIENPPAIPNQNKADSNRTTKVIDKPDKKDKTKGKNNNEIVVPPVPSPKPKKKGLWIGVGAAVVVVGVIGAAIGLSDNKNESEDSTITEAIDSVAFTPTLVTINAANMPVPYEMSIIEGGSMAPGYDISLDSVPAKITVPSFQIGTTEVTQKLWTAVMGTNPSTMKGDNLPVNNVSWDDCQKFIAKLNGMTGMKFRLPTENEWEFAAKMQPGNENSLYPGDNNEPARYSWFAENSGDSIHEVKTKEFNKFGIYDLAGNVIEWCEDSYSGNGTTDADSKALRGGYYGSPTTGIRTISRGSAKKNMTSPAFGFRLALDNK